MTHILVDIKRSAAIGRRRTQNYIRELAQNLFCLFCLLTVSGCMTSGISQPLAPLPPGYNSSISHSMAFSDLRRSGLVDTEIDFVPDYAAAVSAVGHVDMADGISGASLGLSEEKKKTRCRLKDRFDRKALMAYEWDRSRLSMDVDGVNMTSFGQDMAVRIEYKMRIHPEKPRNKKTLCRGHLKFQGLVGTGYHEFFERDENTVWDEVRDEVKNFRQKAAGYVGGVF